MKADGLDRDNRAISRAFLTLLPATVSAAYLYVFMEWLFFATMPSFLNSMTAGEQLRVLLVTALSSALAASLAASALFGVDRILYLRGMSRRFPLGYIVPALILASLSLLMVDNFTYTLLKFGIVSSGGWRGVYLLLFVGGLGCLWWWLATRYASSHRERPPRTLLVLCGVLLVASAGLTVGELRTARARSTGNAQDGSSGRPNVVILGTDGLNAGNMSLYGYSRETTPRITQLAEESLVAENAFANAGNSAGSITSMLTGKSPFETRVLFPPDILTGEDAFEHLPALLRRHGYVTAQFGVPHYIDAFDLNLQGGFDIVNGRQVDEARALRFMRSQGLEDEAYFIARLAERIGGRLLHIFYVRDMQNAYQLVTEPSEPTSDEEKLEGMLDLLLTSERPVFLHAHLMGTHGDRFDPAVRRFSEGEAQTEKWMTDFYDDAILDFDQRVGEFVDALSEAGVLEDTILILTTDHAMLNEPSQRIPLVFRFPGGQPNGRIRNNTQSLDIAPTLLDYLGIPLPTWLDGQSLLQGEPPRHRLIISTRVVIAKSTDIGWVVDEAHIRPPFYQFRYILLIDCQKWYKMNFYLEDWTVGEVPDHTSACPNEDFRSHEELSAFAFAYLSEHGFDVESLADQPLPVYTPTPGAK